MFIFWQITHPLLFPLQFKNWIIHENMFERLGKVSIWKWNPNFSFLVNSEEWLCKLPFWLRKALVLGFASVWLWLGKAETPEWRQKTSSAYSAKKEGIRKTLAMPKGFLKAFQTDLTDSWSLKSFRVKQLKEAAKCKPYIRAPAPAADVTKEGCQTAFALPFFEPWKAKGCSAAFNFFDLFQIFASTCFSNHFVIKDFQDTRRLLKL